MVQLSRAYISHYFFRYRYPVCEQINRQGSEPSLKDKWKYFDLAWEKTTFTATAPTLIFLIQVLQKQEVLLYRCKDTLPLLKVYTVLRSE